PSTASSPRRVGAPDVAGTTRTSTRSRARTPATCSAACRGCSPVCRTTSRPATHPPARPRPPTGWPTPGPTARLRTAMADHKKRTKDDRRAERRQELLDAAVVTIRRDGAGVSMEDIAHEAGITKPILYANFGDKAGLADALAKRFTRDL